MILMPKDAISKELSLWRNITSKIYGYTLLLSINSDFRIYICVRGIRSPHFTGRISYQKFFVGACNIQAERSGYQRIIYSRFDIAGSAVYTDIRADNSS
jgi:hypothetical protein